MIKPHFSFFFCILFIFYQIFPQIAASNPEQDTVRYISDVLVINIKNNLEKPYEVIGSVQSDDQVQVIEQKGNFCKIQTTDGKQGWIGKHYLKSEVPKTILIKQLRQEISDLKTQYNLKQPAVPDTATIGQPAIAPPCQEIQIKLTDAEKLIAQLQADLKAQQNPPPVPSTKASESAIETSSLSTEQLEQTPENFALLVSEYDKRGKKISELQDIISKKDDHTRFLWFAAGALVFLFGMLSGRTTNRKKGKFMY